MSVKQDRITVTFYGEQEVELADKFRALLSKKNKSLNETLKELVNEYVKKS